MTSSLVFATSCVVRRHGVGLRCYDLCMDDSTRRQIELARCVTADERFREGLALCDRTFRLMRDGIRHQFPQATQQDVLRILRDRLDKIRAIETKR